MATAIYICVYTYVHALQLNYRANGQRAARHQERAQRPGLILNEGSWYYATAAAEFKITILREM